MKSLRGNTHSLSKFFRLHRYVQEKTKCSFKKWCLLSNLKNHLVILERYNTYVKIMVDDVQRLES